MPHAVKKAHYAETTSAANHESWAWYQAMLQEMKVREAPEWRPIDPLPPEERLPVEVGIRFCAWIMETPEIRDIIYRRFVCGDYGNKTEEMLLTASSFHFLHQEGYSVGHFAKLSLCWRVAAKIIKGEYSDPESDEVRQRLLRYSNFFFSNEGHLS